MCVCSPSFVITRDSSTITRYARLRLHAIVLQRQDLVARGREAHHAIAMDVAFLVDDTHAASETNTES